MIDFLKKYLVSFIAVVALLGCTSNNSNSNPGNGNKLPEGSNAEGGSQSTLKKSSDDIDDTSLGKIEKLYSFKSLSTNKIYMSDDETQFVNVINDKAQIINLESGNIEAEISFSGEPIKDCQINDYAVLLMSDNKIQIYNLNTKKVSSIINKNKFIFASMDMYSSFGKQIRMVVYQSLINDGKYDLPSTSSVYMDDSDFNKDVTDPDAYGWGPYLQQIEVRNGSKSEYFARGAKSYGNSETPANFLSNRGAHKTNLELLGGWYTGNANRPSEWKKVIATLTFEYSGGSTHLSIQNSQGGERLVGQFKGSDFYTAEIFDQNTVRVKNPATLHEYLYDLNDGPNTKPLFSTENIPGLLIKPVDYMIHTLSVQILRGSLINKLLYVAVSGIDSGKKLYAINLEGKILGQVEYESSEDFKRGYGQDHFESNEVMFSITPNYFSLQNRNGKTIFYSTDLKEEIFHKKFGVTNEEPKFYFSKLGKYVIYTEKTATGTSADVWLYKN